jgi:2-phosphosulfolactate phosphatase
MRVEVRLTPSGPPVTSGATLVAVDVLRATSTLTCALAHGAARVLEAASVEEGFAIRDRNPGSLLCGERDGRIVPGFDLGNSPFEYPAERVSGRTLVFASTNGSQALRLGRTADRRVLAAFVNLEAAVAKMRDAARVVIVCAGKLGAFALEDAACAGLLVERLRAAGARVEGTAATLAARLAPRDADGVRALVEGSAHGLWLRSLGPEFARDVEFCAGLDTLDCAFEA